MSIRTKLLILLLGLTIGAMGVNAVIELRGTARFGQRLSEQSRAELEQRGQRELVQTVNGHRKVLTAEARVAELALLTIAADAERVLARTDVPSPEVSPLDADAWRAHARASGAFDTPISRPPGSGPFASVVPGEPLTFDEQAFGVAPDADTDTVARQADALTSLTRTYRRLSAPGMNASAVDDPPVFALRQIALESGLFAAYPFIESFPERYDPREMDWYRSAMRLSTLQGRPFEDVGAMLWNRVASDPITGQVVITGSAPVRGADGTPIGAAAIDIPMPDLLDRLAPPAEWGATSTTMLVLPVPPALSDDERAVLADKMRLRTGELLDADRRLIETGGVLVLAQRQGEAATITAASDATDVARIPVEPGDDGVRTLVARMLTRDVGTALLGEGDNAAMWAWGRIDRETFLALAVPYTTVTAEAETLRTAIEAETAERLNTTLAVTLGVMAIAALLALLASSRLIRPLVELRGAVERIAGGDFDARADVQTTDEIGSLGRTFNAMVPQLADRVRLRESMNVAMRVQQHLLPSCPPEIPGFEIAAASVYCDETGGDYFDFATREVGGEPRTLIAVGDVTGHGIDAALLMASARAILRSRVASSTGLAELAAAMNEQLFVDSLDGRFMTLFLLELDPQGSRIRWVSAGHEPALLYHPDRDEFEDLGGRDIPLGVEAGWRFRPAERKGLEPGQILLMGTDGIWETRDPAGELFGKDRLRQLVRDHAAGPIDGLQAAIEQALMRHRGTRAQEDDITLVVLRATGSSETIAKRAPSAPAATR